MSMSRTQLKPRTRTAPKAYSPATDPKLLLIKQRINQIASNMRSPLKPSNSPLSASTRDLHSKPQKSKPDLESFLASNNLESCTSYLLENQISLSDLPYLTKDDLIDMKIPLGPRNRLLKLIESFDRSDTESRLETSPKRGGLRDEVDRFMNELSQFSKRSDPKLRPSSRDQSFEGSFESEGNSQRAYDSVLGLLKEISEKQKFMMKAIEENQKAIAVMRAQNSRGRCRCGEYRQ